MTRVWETIRIKHESTDVSVVGASVEQVGQPMGQRGCIRRVTSSHLTSQASVVGLIYYISHFKTSQGSAEGLVGRN